MRHLRGKVGRRVRVDLDKPDRTAYGVLTELRPSGPRVRLDGEDRDRTVAAWRITTTGGQA